MGSLSEISKSPFGVLAICLLLLLIGGGVESEGRKVVVMSPPPAAAGNLKHVEDQLKEIGTSRKLIRPRPASVLGFMSKRKVPNGPDPIHNRGSGKYKQPPRHAYTMQP